MHRTSWRVGLAIMLAVSGTFVGAAVGAAVAAQPAADPLRCWWTPDKNAVRVGELFQLTLTCRVMETERASVVPNLSEIEPSSIQLTPFEVLGGTRHEDIVTPPWRYLQFVYTVRLLGEEFFGRDVAIPQTNLTFRVQTTGGGGGSEAAEGAEQAYLLPSLPMRILSLLPAQAADILDPPAGTFGDIEARRFRSKLELVGAAALFGLAGVLAIVAAVRLIERFRKRGPAAEPMVPIRTLLGGCLSELERIRAEAAREGWTPGLAARALTSFRIAAAVALSQPVTQTFVDDETEARDGQLAVAHGILRRRHALVSASTTADSMDRLRAARGRRRGRNQDALDPLREALVGLNAARYGRDGDADALELDRILDNGSRAVRRMRTAQHIPSWPR